MGSSEATSPPLKPVSYLMSDGDAQVEARVLCNHAVPVPGTGPAELSHSSNLLVPIWQLQVEPACGSRPSKACLLRRDEGKQ